MKVFIGYDARESNAYRVCVASIVQHTRDGFDVTPVNGRLLGASYARKEMRDGDGRLWDLTAGRAPMSTEFANARFYVPHMARSGWALYCDGDFMFRADLRDLFALADSRYAVHVVPHRHVPLENVKMDGQVQTTYDRKNWSSLMLFNCDHPAVRDVLTPDYLNRAPGLDLHQFKWLDDHLIGALPYEWNYLVGVADWRVAPKCKAAHFTLGTPDMPGWGRHGSFLSDEWRSYACRQG